MSKRKEIVEAIRLKLMMNDFSPGESIPEESLAAEFHVSRTPIREALLVLERQRLVSMEQNRGAKVASISIESIRSFFEAAKHEYSITYAFAAERITDGEIQKLDQQINRMSELVEPEHFRERTQVNVAFMESLAKAARNDFLYDSVYCLIGYHVFIRTSISRNLSSDAKRAIAQEDCLHYQNILDGVRGRDPKVTKEMVAQRLDSSRVFLISNFV